MLGRLDRPDRLSATVLAMESRKKEWWVKEKGVSIETHLSSVLRDVLKDIQKNMEAQNDRS